MDNETSIRVNAALREQANTIMRRIGEYWTQDEDGEYAVAAYRVMSNVIPDLTPERWRELTKLSPDGVCQDWSSCCGWCSEHDEHCGRDEAEMNNHCGECGRCAYCAHYCYNFD